MTPVVTARQILNAGEKVNRTPISNREYYTEKSSMQVEMHFGQLVCKCPWGMIAHDVWAGSRLHEAPRCFIPRILIGEEKSHRVILPQGGPLHLWGVSRRGINTGFINTWRTSRVGKAEESSGVNEDHYLDSCQVSLSVCHLEYTFLGMLNSS